MEQQKKPHVEEIFDIVQTHNYKMTKYTREHGLVGINKFERELQAETKQKFEALGIELDYEPLIGGTRRR